MKNKKDKKKIKPIRFLLITLLIIILLILFAFCAVIVSLVFRYNSFSYEYQPPVERTETYVMPDYPDLIFDSENTGEETVSIPETSVEPVIPEETDPLQTEQIETEAPSVETQVETDKAETEENELSSPAIIGQPDETEIEIPVVIPETLAPVITPPASTTAPYVAPENPDASFENSPNALSVYGSVPIYKENQKNPDVMNILLLGTDSRDIIMDRGRSDTMIILSYNTKTGSIKLTSLLRDSLVPIEGHGWDRINTAYFYGGVGLAINTVNQLYDLDIQHFAVIDLNGARNLIHRIGGVNITLNQEEADFYNMMWSAGFKAGINYMEGDRLFIHMRNRTIGTDFERTRRQRDVMIAIVNKITTEKSASEIFDLVDYTLGLVKTNIPLTTLTSLTSSVIGNLSKLSISSQNVPYNDAFRYATYNGSSVISYDISEAAKRLNQFIYN